MEVVTPNLCWERLAGRSCWHLTRIVKGQSFFGSAVGEKDGLDRVILQPQSQGWEYLQASSFYYRLLSSGGISSTLQSPKLFHLIFLILCIPSTPGRIQANRLAESVIREQWGRLILLVDEAVAQQYYSKSPRMYHLDSLLTGRDVKITKPHDKHNSRHRPSLRDTQYRNHSLCSQRRQGTPTLIKINKKRLPKDFFRVQGTPQTSRAPPKDLQEQSCNTNFQTLDTPEKSESQLKFAEDIDFNRTSFFGNNSVWADITPAKDSGIGQYRSCESRSQEKSKRKGKSTVPPIIYRSVSFQPEGQQLFNCTFAKETYRANSSLQNNYPRGSSREGDNLSLKPVKRCVKWSDFMNMNMNMHFQGETQKAATPNVVGEFKLRRKLIANRPISQLPQIFS